jgi:hypothetical protein
VFNSKRDFFSLGCSAHTPPQLWLLILFNVYSNGIGLNFFLSFYFEVIFVECCFFWFARFVLNFVSFWLFRFVKIQKNRCWYQVESIQRLTLKLPPLSQSVSVLSFLSTPTSILGVERTLQKVARTDCR